MKAIIENKFIFLFNPSDCTKTALHKVLSYTDKAKEYQVKRMKKNPFSNKGFIKKLEKEVEQNAYRILDNGTWVIPTGLLEYVKKIDDIEIVEDRRKDTGSTLPLPWNKEPFKMRDYQRESVDVMLDNYRGTIALATGLGKSLCAVYAVKQTRKNTLIVVPSESIAKQFYKIMCDAFGDKKIGMYGGGKHKINNITIGIAASITRNIDKFKELELGLVLFDEIHHIAASTFFKISSGLGGVGRMYGMTATAYRGDGKDILIRAGCGPILIKRDIVWGVKNKWLAKPKFFIRSVDTCGINSKHDKLKNYKAHVLNNAKMKKIIYNDIKTQIDNGRCVLCLVAEVEHGEELSKQLGIPFAKGADKCSQDYVDDLNNSKINALIGTAGKISEGTDTKRVDALILASFVAGKGPVIQSIGRGLRIHASKTDCLIFDYIPKGSDMLTRHAMMRKSYYDEITDEVQIC